MTLTILRLGHQGDGIADGPDGPVFAPLTLPGEEIEGEPRNNRIENPRIITPSSDRVRAPCSHFKKCGGCALQHASDQFVSAWKSEIVQNALRSQEIDIPVPPPLVSPPKSRRRATLGGKRTQKGALVGFHARGSKTIIPVPSCTLLKPEIVSAIPALERLTTCGASRKAVLSISATVSLNGLDIAVTGGKDPDLPLLEQLGGISRDAGFARLSWNGEIIATNAPPEQRFGTAHVVPPPGSFLQATAEGQEALTDAVLEGIGNARHVADLFSGCGTFTLPVAAQAEVTAFENDPEAIAALDAGWRKGSGLKTVTAIRRDLFRRPVLAGELDRFDAVVIDPPRAGAQAQIAEIASSRLGHVVHVSCNPVTFARDARTLLSAGFRIGNIKVIDQFRWSPHVELVARFSRD
ncbi:MAG: RsmD family RNA methyltransferase [Paracoccaceae bacterium]|nr:RsmD family RNA methyltransferase [Paracoccaceae bacterium]